MLENIRTRAKEFMMFIKAKAMSHYEEKEPEKKQVSARDNQSHVMTEDEKIDESIDESFPASDPPAH